MTSLSIEVPSSKLVSDEWARPPKRSFHLVVVIAVLSVLLVVTSSLAGVFAYQSYNQPPAQGESSPPTGILVPMAKHPRSRPNTVSKISNLTDPKNRRALGALEGAAWADYSAHVTIGGESFEVIVDTGSSTFAVGAASGIGCDPHYIGTCDGKYLDNQYGSGSWTGKLCTGAAVSFEGVTAGQPPFAGIKTQHNFLKDCSPTDGISSQGIVGMAFAALATTAPFDQATLFDSVVAANSGMQPIFSMQCCGWSGGSTAGTGALVLGGVHPSLYTGTITYTPLTHESYYCVKLISPPMSTYTYGCGEGNAVIDSGTSALVLKSQVYEAVTSPIFDAQPSLQNLVSSGDCIPKSAWQDLPCISLTLDGGMTFSIPPENYMQPVPGQSDCYEFLITEAGYNVPINIIGQVMMESYFTVFDKGNKRVGFAPINGCPTAPASCLPLAASVKPPPPPSSGDPSPYPGQATHPTVSSSSLTCSSYTNCVSCAAAPMHNGEYCGWCDGKCSAGNPEGTCTGYWAWEADQCSCGSYTDCDACVRDTGFLNPKNECGWCGGTCVNGDPESMALAGQCPGGWAWIADQCIAG